MVHKPLHVVQFYILHNPLGGFYSSQCKRLHIIVKQVYQIIRYNTNQVCFLVISLMVWDLPLLYISIIPICKVSISIVNTQKVWITFINVPVKCKLYLCLHKMQFMLNWNVECVEDILRCVKPHKTMHCQHHFTVFIPYFDFWPLWVLISPQVSYNLF